MSGDFQGPNGPLLSYSIQAHSEAFGGPRPQAIATAEAHGTPTAYNVPVRGEAYANVDYAMQIVSRGNAPEGVSIPLRISILQDVTGEAESIVQLDDAFLRLGILSGHQSREFFYRQTYSESQTVHVILTARAIAVDNYGIGPARPFSSQAVADPVFEFDQQAFDDLMGPDTFSLADFYSFEFSPGAELIPEPSSVLLCLAGLMCFTNRRKRHARTA